MINLMHGDCLERMKEIPDNSIDLVLTDPPYGTTACKWDTVIEFESMWKELKRVTNPNTAICLFGSEPFSSSLRMSNIKMFKYDWVLRKTRPTGMLNCNRQPMRNVEIVSVFYKKQCLYIPQKTKGKPNNGNGTAYKLKTKTPDQYGSYNYAHEYEITEMKFPTQILEFKKGTNSLHPTQKPVALLEYLIKTYTLEGETVLDFTMGSGSTGVAANNLDRKFIGIEMDDYYFKVAEARIHGNDEVLAKLVADKKAGLL